MALIGILSAISYPLYTEHIAKKNRDQAKITLLEIGNRLEEAYMINGNYKNINKDSMIPITATKLPFQFAITTPNEHEYLIKAIPTSSTTYPSDNACQTLTLSSQGDYCW